MEQLSNYGFCVGIMMGNMLRTDRSESKPIGGGRGVLIINYLSEKIKYFNEIRTVKDKSIR